MIATKSFDLNLLRVFAYIYMFRNLTRASEALNLTQPAVSRSLSKLNNIYGEKLFIRQRNEMMPSRLAEHISDSIFKALAEAEKAIGYSKNFDANEQTLDIQMGLNDYGVSTLFPSLYKSFNLASPQSILHTTHCTYANASRQFETMQIDGAIVSEAPESKRLHSVPLFTDDYVVICHAKHDITANAFPLDIFLQKKHTLVSYSGGSQGWVDDRLLQMGLKREIACSIHLFSLLPQVVVELDVIATIPRRIAQQLAKHYPIALYELPFVSKAHHFHFVRPRYSINAAYSDFILNTVVAATT